MAGFDANIVSGYYASAIADAQATYDANNKLADGSNGGWNLAELNVGQLAFYAQDEWNINDNFKLIYGLRADKPLYFNTSKLIQKFIDTDDKFIGQDSYLREEEVGMQNAMVLCLHGEENGILN